MTDSSAVKQEDASAAGGGSAATPVPGGSAAAMPTPAADTSPSPSTPSAGRTTLPRRATVGEVALSSSSTTPPQTPASSSSASCHRWRPRSKSVSNACERCRRRKIRCDGDSQSGPCSTCVRFCVACVRPPRPRDHRHGGLGAHRALASRIQYLEAQLAEMGDVSHAHSHSNASWAPDDSSWLHVVSPASATIATTTATTPRPCPAQPPPSLHLDTTAFGLVPQQRRSLSWDSGAGVLGGALGSSSSSNANRGGGNGSGAHPVPDIPTIEISECVDDEDGGSGGGAGGDHLSPPSALLSPAPSLVLSASSRASTPEPHAVTTPILASSSTLAPPLFGSPVSPPVSACPSSRQPPPGLWGDGFPLLTHGGDGNDDFLSPRSPKTAAWSRRSSVSSLGLDQDFCSIDLQFSGFDDEGPPLPPPQSPGGIMASGSYFPQHQGRHRHQPPHRPHSSSFLETATTTGLPRPAAAAAAARKVPTKFEAETLADILFARVPPAHLPIDRIFHQTCLDLVYNEGDDASGFLEILLAPYSQRMARFYVFMATALGMRLRICGGGGHVRPADQKLLESAYGLAMEEVAADPGFWVEAGGVEAAKLVELFAKTGDGGDGGLGDTGDLQPQRDECSDMMDY